LIAFTTPMLTVSANLRVKRKHRTFGTSLVLPIINLEMSNRSKWWPLPSHAPLPIRKSTYSFPKVATLKMLYCNIDGEPASDTVWLKPWHVPLSKRISDQAEWHSIIEKLG